MSDQVIVECKGTRWANGRSFPVVQTYTGTILPNRSYEGADVIALSTDVPDWWKFPRRVISKKEIISIKKFDSEENIPFTVMKEETKSHTVQGSGGKEYTVKQVGSNFTCTCVGYGFRKDCKHVNSVKAN